MNDGCTVSFSTDRYTNYSENTMLYLGLLSGFIFGFLLGIGAFAELAKNIKIWRDSFKKQYHRHGLQLGDFALYEYYFGYEYLDGETYSFEIVDGDTKKTKIRWQLNERWFDLDDKSDVLDLICWVKSPRWYPESEVIKRYSLFPDSFPIPLEVHKKVSG